MKCCALYSVFLCLFTPLVALADTYSFYFRSLEWAVDTSDFIVEATVVCQQDPQTKKWQTTVEKVHRVLKPVAGKSVPAIDDLSEAVITANGRNKVLLFAFRNEEKKTVSLYYCIYLNKHEAPGPAEKHKAYYQDLLPGQDSTSEPMQFYHDKCIAIDKNGEILSDPGKVIERVEQRIKLNPQAATEKGSFNTKVASFEGSDDYNLAVPFDPEFKKDFLKELRSERGWWRYEAAFYLSNYKDDEVIAALKQCLGDTYVGKLRIEFDGQAAKPNQLKEFYIVRKAAYESLRKMGVNVPKPELEPPANKP